MRMRAAGLCTLVCVAIHSLLGSAAAQDSSRAAEVSALFDELQSISDDFVLALRADATDDDLAVSAALPLTTVAANLGELELLYPHPVEPVPSAG